MAALPWFTVEVGFYQFLGDPPRLAHVIFAGKERGFTGIRLASNWDMIRLYAHRLMGKGAL
jgi:hypothetical protein